MATRKKTIFGNAVRFKANKEPQKLREFEMNVALKAEIDPPKQVDIFRYFCLVMRLK